MIEGIIVKGIAGFYYVKSDDGVIECKARGVFKKYGVKPMVGDNVRVEVKKDGGAVMISIGERKNEFIRPPVSNVDFFIVTVAAAKPSPDFRLLDKVLLTAEKNGAGAIICVNKIDIAAPSEVRLIEDIYEGIYPLICVSALTGRGVDELRAAMTGGRYAFTGPSGVGKSTLLNLLHPSAGAEMGELSKKTERGRHTTRSAEIFEIETGVLVCDTPGFTAFSTAIGSADEVMHLFPEIAKYYGKCKFKNCMHLEETGCAVREAVKEGVIHLSRYDSYREICREITDSKTY